MKKIELIRWCSTQLVEARNALTAEHPDIAETLLVNMAAKINTEHSETESPETESPETESPETESPETESPETESPETESPETEGC